ncbi:signal recognition particle-docking protein FtsY [Marinicauda algicola]|uniref:Signal recognition particle receptor FtsY n=1 Tax=Marinicauda algicola TaxID=2029849 RepID=A0A4S2H148_9PROT|nr:signal recognition particle-docking protein FtsY [Marinicauda algicola]TGY89133.1 signal recognition particle-docking protein FtsY [Marinicauda algicola]
MSWFSFGFGKKKKDEVREDPVAEATESTTPGEEGDDPGIEPIEEAPKPDAAEPLEVEAEKTGEAGTAEAPSEPAGQTLPPERPSPEAGPRADEAPVPQEQRDSAGEVEPEAPVPEEKKGFLSRLASGLKRSSSRLSEQVSSVFTRRRLDDEALEELEDLLIGADLGAKTAARVTARLARDKFDKDVTETEIREALADVVAETLKPFEKPLDMSGEPPRVVLFVGVNGSGKTTTLGKIAVKMTREGGKVLNVAGDTFRAAAVEQLEVWSGRAGAKAQFMSREIGADAAGLAYDAVAKGRKEGFDAVLIDTAGRLQNKTELMDELRKIVRVIKKLDETAPHHTVLVLDGTVGSNAISQAEAFLEAAQITGVIMTKLDGTAKGGALVQVAEQFQLPIHYIGVGEGEADLQPFDARAFARALAGLEG